jgi:hypothetical protein
MLRPCLSLPTLFRILGIRQECCGAVRARQPHGFDLRWIGQVARCRKTRFGRLLRHENARAFENAGQLRFILAASGCDISRPMVRAGGLRSPSWSEEKMALPRGIEPLFQP